METNPYAPPLADLSPQEKPDALRLREEHINVEATIKSVGVLYFLGAMVVILFGVMGFASGETTGRLPLAIFFCGLGFFQGWVGYGLRKLQSWARIPTIIFSCIGLLAFPLGTLINGYILSQLLSKKANFVLSDEYKSIIIATPQVKRKTSKVVWVLLFAFIALLVGSLLVGIFSR